MLIVAIFSPNLRIEKGGSNDAWESCVVHVTRICRTRSASRLSRPGAGYPRSEGSGAKCEVYLGIATPSGALRAELEDIQTQLRHHSLRVSVKFLAAHWR